ncbi:unnamed protein product [Diatraea saccharalis]|uniref:Uncharacterized protein n=1 Tax=Diatraea saccharalis TaxID=40085 RepID=A0A9N9R296_9NEOP|nr:unnamed protein product [Diatraea saccharalis]
MDNKEEMQADYPEKYPPFILDPVHVEYPVRKFPGTGDSSETIAHKWKSQPEVLTSGKTPIEEIKNYLYDYNITKELNKSQTIKDFDYKHAEKMRFNKHTSCLENHYIYPLSRRISERQPQCSAFTNSTMKESYSSPTIPPRLVTDKDQFKHPASLPLDPSEIEPKWRKDFEPLDTTHEGFEKYLDPYLTTSRLHHRPFTADQLTKSSASKDIITYYTFADVAWTRAPLQKPEHCNLPVTRPKSIYDREKFKEDFREIRTHNKQRWVPSSFRTETRDNYRSESAHLSSFVDNPEEDVRNYYSRRARNLPTNDVNEQATIQQSYNSETSHVIGTGRPICTVLDQYVKKNKRLERKMLKR